MVSKDKPVTQYKPLDLVYFILPHISLFTPTVEISKLHSLGYWLYKNNR